MAVNKDEALNCGRGMVWEREYEVVEMSPHGAVQGTDDNKVHSGDYEHWSKIYGIRRAVVLLR